MQIGLEAPPPASPLRGGFDRRGGSRSTSIRRLLRRLFVVPPDGTRGYLIATVPRHLRRLRRKYKFIFNVCSPRASTCSGTFTKGAYLVRSIYRPSATLKYSHQHAKIFDSVFANLHEHGIMKREKKFQHGLLKQQSVYSSLRCAVLTVAHIANFDPALKLNILFNIYFEVL